jgi:hypothetical protein
VRSPLRTLALIAGFGASAGRAGAGDSALLSIEPGACKEAEFAEPLLDACDRAFANGHCRFGEAGASLHARLERLDEQRVRVIVVGSDGTDRHAELTFAAADSWSERAKAVGLAVGALAASTTRAAPDAVEGAGAPASDAAEEPAPAPQQAAEPAHVEERPTPSASGAARAEPNTRYLLLLQADMASDPGLDHLEGGAGLRGWVKFPVIPLTWRVGFDALGGRDAADSFASTRLQPTLGVGNDWRIQRWALELGVDGGFEWQNAASTSMAASRITPLLRVQVSALFDVVEHVGLSLSAQSSVTFSPTDVYVDGVERAHGSGYQWGLGLGVYRRFGD